MDIEKVFKFKEGVRFFDFEENSFVVDTSELSLYNLGMSSALISANLNGENNLEKMIDIIRMNYNVSASDGERAVAKFIALMQQQNLIQEV